MRVVIMSQSRGAMVVERYLVYSLLIVCCSVSFLFAPKRTHSQQELFENPFVSDNCLPWGLAEESEEAQGDDSFIDDIFVVPRDLEQDIPERED